MRCPGPRQVPVDHARPPFGGATAPGEPTDNQLALPTADQGYAPQGPTQVRLLCVPMIMQDRRADRHQAHAAREGHTAQASGADGLPQVLMIVGSDATSAQGAAQTASWPGAATVCEATTCPSTAMLHVSREFGGTPMSETCIFGCGM